MQDLTLRLTSLFGLFFLIFVAWLLSSNRKKFPVRIVVGGLLLQVTLAAIVMLTKPGQDFFSAANAAVSKFQEFVSEGSGFVFGLFDGAAEEVGGNNMFPLASFAFGVLPTVIVFASLMAVLYHLGVMQRLVQVVAWGMQRTLGTSGPETLAAAANIFVGHTEAPLVVRPYLERLSKSELNALMVGGYATVTGSLLATYASMGVEAGHLVTASVISGPAALMIAKIMQPEEADHEAEQSLALSAKSEAPNVIGAAAQGASDGLKLALNIAAMLIAFLALLALADFLVAQAGALVGFRDEAGNPTISFTILLAYLFTPVAYLLGIPWEEAFVSGRLLGVKVVANEVVAYNQLGQLLASEEAVSDRTRHILTYALCGFSNFSAIGIQVGGIGGLAPGRRDDVARLGLRAMIGGTIACLMTACIAGVFL
ncbi:MAG: nucleoside transporter C-terminal domain-containing protein [Aureliella sp.]